jgi:Ca-activated chloride channel family protein
MNWDTFHLLRPAWLFALLPLVPILIATWRLRSDAPAWHGVCDSHLLRHLLVEEDGSRKAWPLALLALGWGSTTLALSGPTWEKLPQPTYALTEPTVLVLNMSPSMDATDTSPSRMARARYKLIDAIDHLDGAPAGLVIFNEEPYVVTPVTDDGKVIAETVPILETNLMPGGGMRVDRALTEATDLLVQAGATRGRILLVTDGAGDAPDQAVGAARAAKGAGHTVSVLSVGNDSEEGALEDIATAGGGAYAALTADDRDLRITLPQRAPVPNLLGGSGADPSSARADIWRDMGGWLVILPLLLALMAFRRGSAVACSGVLAVAFLAPSSRAADVGDLFQTPDQRGVSAFEMGRHDEAAGVFEDPAWRGSAEYRSGDFDAAVATLAELDDLESRYNLGNALAKSQRFEEALSAYDEVLEQQPDHADARHNRDLIQDLLDQQQEEEQQEQQQQEQDQEQGQEGQEQQGQDQEEQQGDSQQQDSSPQGGESGEQQDDSSPTESEPAQPEPGDPERPDRSDPSEDTGEAGDRPDDGRPDPETAELTDEQPTTETPVPLSPDELSEQDQATEQLLSRIPDDPGGLLREKLRRRYIRDRYDRLPRGYR